jgi:hypothetical protein
MGLTTNQKKVLKAIGKHNETRNVAANGLGITQGALDATLNQIYTDFKDTLEALDEYYEVFARRLKHESDNEVYSRLRRIARKMKEGSA